MEIIKSAVLAVAQGPTGTGSTTGFQELCCDWSLGASVKLSKETFQKCILITEAKKVTSVESGSGLGSEKSGSGLASEKSGPRLAASKSSPAA